MFKELRELNKAWEEFKRKALPLMLRCCMWGAALGIVAFLIRLLVWGIE